MGVQKCLYCKEVLPKNHSSQYCDYICEAAADIYIF